MLGRLVTRDDIMATETGLERLHRLQRLEAQARAFDRRLTYSALVLVLLGAAGLVLTVLGTLALLCGFPGGSISALAGGAVAITAINTRPLQAR